MITGWQKFNNKFIVLIIVHKSGICHYVLFKHVFRLSSLGTFHVRYCCIIFYKKIYDLKMSRNWVGYDHRQRQHLDASLCEF